MRDTIKTPPPDRTRDPMQNRGGGSGTGRWIGIAVVAVLGLVLVFWLTGMMDDTADMDATPSASVPADEAIVDPEQDTSAIQPQTDPAPETDVEAETETIPSTPPE